MIAGVELRYAVRAPSSDSSEDSNIHAVIVGEILRDKSPVCVVLAEPMIILLGEPESSSPRLVGLDPPPDLGSTIRDLLLDSEASPMPSYATVYMSHGV